MTTQAQHVMEECDFPVVSPEMEMVLTRHLWKQVVSLVWSKDPNGKHSDFDWFLPFFNSYLPKTLQLPSIVFDDRFWEAYKLLDKFVEPYDNSLFPLVSEMSEDVMRLSFAMGKSKPNLKYVYKVWSGMHSRWVEETYLPEIEKHDVRTTKLD